MMILSSPASFLDSSINTHSARGPVAKTSSVQFHCSWTRGRLIPTVRCVVLGSHQHARLGSICSAPGSRGVGWVARTRRIAEALADTHKAWSSQSFQTLQRVGSMIRSTSLDCLAALGSKKGSSLSDQQPSEDDDGCNHSATAAEQDADEQTLVKAYLSRFLAVASDAEVHQAAKMSDLSNMAYDVLDVTASRLQKAHGLTLVTHSRSRPAAEPQSQLLLDQVQQVLQERDDEHGHLLQQAPPSAQEPRPISTVLLQPTGGSVPEFSLLPVSPRSPMAMRSYAEDEAPETLPAEYFPVTASGSFADPGSPRRPSAAAAVTNAAAGGLTSLGMPAATSMNDAPPTSTPPAWVRQHSGPDQSHVFQQQWLMPDTQDQGANEHVGADEQLLMQQLKQQEALLLLEMHASQQLLWLFQQSQQQMEVTGPGESLSAQHERQLQDLTMSAASTVSAAASAAAAAGAPTGSSSIHTALHADPGHTVQSTAMTAAADAPADWFCCDGPLSSSDATPTRFFAIQGSITLEHWRINLTIDPCEFEGGRLGPVQVHRGMYMAALDMYDTILPHVQQHLKEHPGGKIALTGHSLGGSLATLLMLLMIHRGDVSPASMDTVYTFGAPAVFCEVANGSPASPGACQACQLPCEHRRADLAAAGSSATDSLLTKLGLSNDAVVNVIMSRDIVPRAFVCDYTLVAGVLKSWLPSFKEHSGLAACKEHKALYNFIGVVEVLQPGDGCDFVLADEGHDMLPAGAALYKLTEPRSHLHQEEQQQQQPPAAYDNSGSGCSLPHKESFNSLTSLAHMSSSYLSSTLAELTNTFSLGGSKKAAQQGVDEGQVIVTVPVDKHDVAVGPSEGLGPETEPPAVHDSAGRPLVGPCVRRGSPNSTTAVAVAAPAPGTAAGTPVASSSVPHVSDELTLGDAILTFMNSPHPLQTLGEMRAYGNNGSISRYHNPQSYTKALEHLSKQ